jgi:hypothetical protein
LIEKQIIYIQINTPTKEKEMSVKNREEAQMVIAKLLEEFSGETAQQRMRFTGKCAHQSNEEVAWRVAGNLLTSFEMFRPFSE